MMSSPLLKPLVQFVGTAEPEPSELCNAEAASASIAAPEYFGNAELAPIFFKSDSAQRVEKKGHMNSNNLDQLMRVINYR
jgi:hypothetical protein